MNPTKVPAWPLILLQVGLVAFHVQTHSYGSELFWATSLMVCVLAWFVESQRRLLRKHQEALVWFANHVRMDPRAGEEPVPEDLEVLIKRD